MDNRKKVDKKEKFIAPYRSFEGIDGYIDDFLRYTYRFHPKYPYAVKKLPFITAAFSAALFPSYFIDSIPQSLGAGLSAAGMIGLTLSFAAGFIQQSVFGLPVDNKPFYQETYYAYKEATATIRVIDGHLPQLYIKSNTYHDAGVVEGRALSRAMKAHIDALKPVFHFLRVVAGHPKGKRFKDYFNDFLRTIPPKYIDEMIGKVEGYNQWLKENYPDTQPLEFEEYLFINSIPGYRNYLPIQDCAFVPFIQQNACTSYAVRLGDITIIARLLDFAFYGQVNTVIEVMRDIEGCYRMSEVAHPFLSGSLTAVNEKGVLLQINVANGEKIQNPAPERPPDIFYIRQLAEKCSSVSEVVTMTKEIKPLSAFHLIASDGKDTQFIHLFQNLKDPRQHVYESLSTDKEKPQLLAVANLGIEKKGNQYVELNFRCSKERVENIMTFFHHPPAQEKLKAFIAKQQDPLGLSQEDINAIFESLILEATRLPLVCSAATAQAIFFLYVNNQLTDAIAALNNSFASKNELGQFKQLSLFFKENKSECKSNVPSALRLNPSVEKPWIKSCL
jgi:hypothetical protein